MRRDRLRDGSPMHWLSCGGSFRGLGVPRRPSAKIWSRLDRGRLSESFCAQRTTHPPSHIVFKASCNIYLRRPSSVCSTCSSTFSMAPNIVYKLASHFSSSTDQLKLGAWSAEQVRTKQTRDVSEVLTPSSLILYPSVALCLQGCQSNFESYKAVAL
ncbi:hypothetical protein BC827DRAFT_1248172 [Russula dissimulans]|nr:hypothetical protein BC827DRAFT_1248172 [Russula dissimulans]